MNFKALFGLLLILTVVSQAAPGDNIKLLSHTQTCGSPFDDSLECVTIYNITNPTGSITSYSSANALNVSFRTSAVGADLKTAKDTTSIKGVSFEYSTGGKFNPIDFEKLFSVSVPPGGNLLLKITATKQWVPSGTMFEEKLENIDNVVCVAGYCDYTKAWWNTTYNYRRLLNISSYGNPEYVNNTFNITFDSLTAITAGKMYNNCSDLAFTYANASLFETEIPFYLYADVGLFGTTIGKCAGGYNNASVFLKIPLISNTTNNSIYYYYNSTTAYPKSNAYQTMPIFDGEQTSGLNRTIFKNDTSGGSSPDNLCVAANCYRTGINTTFAPPGGAFRGFFINSTYYNPSVGLSINNTVIMYHVFSTATNARASWHSTLSMSVPGKGVFFRFDFSANGGNCTFINSTPGSCGIIVGAPATCVPQYFKFEFYDAGVASVQNFTVFNKPSKPFGYGAGTEETNIADPDAPNNFTYVVPSTANGTYYDQNWVYVNVTFNETNPNNCKLIVNMTVNYTMSRNGTNCYYNLTGLNWGLYNFTVSAADDAGNSNSSNMFNVTLLNRGPWNLTFIEPTSTGVGYQNWVYVNFTFNDNDGVSCRLMMNNSANITMTKAGNNCYVNVTGLTYGNQNFSVVVNDSASNTNTSSMQFVTLLNTSATLFRAFDLLSGLQLYFNATITNGTNSYTTPNTANNSVGSPLLPQGFSTITFNNASYFTVSQLATITNDTQNYTAYMLPKGDTNAHLVTFYVIDSLGSFVPNATVSFYQAGNLVAQAITDSGGATSQWVDFTLIYLIIVTASGYSTVTSSITPVESTYYIPLGVAGTGGGYFSDYFGITQEITPGFLNSSGNWTTINYTITAYKGDLTLFGLNITYEGVVTAYNLSNSSYGGYILINVTSYNRTNNITAVAYFKKLGGINTYTKVYWITNFVDSPASLTNLAARIQGAGGLNFTTILLVAILSMAAVSAVTRFQPIAAVGGLLMVAFVGFFGLFLFPLSSPFWIFYGVMILLAIALAKLQVGG